MTFSDKPSHLRPRPGLLLPLALATMSVVLRVVAPAEWMESLYSRGIFRGVRGLLDYGLGWLPLPLFYVFWLGVIVFLIQLVRRYRSARDTLRVVAAALCWLVVAFLWLWGFNYGRPGVEERLAFALHQPDLAELRKRVYGEGAALGRLRGQITRDSHALALQHFPPALEDSMRRAVQLTLEANGYPAPGRPRGWQLLPRGILLRLSTAGVYWPWAGQGNIDAGLHPLQRPAVLAHELSHAYGFGDEGTCSFWALLAEDHVSDPVLEYSLRLAYWRQLAGRLRYADPDNYLRWRAEELDAGMRNDLQAIYDNGAKYEDLAPALRDATYTAYLKAQGIHDGLLNYGRVVQLVEGYRRHVGSAG